MIRNEMAPEKVIEHAEKLFAYFNTKDPFEICELLGIQIEFRKYAKHLKGYIIKTGLGATIFINEIFDLKSRKIICAHELGHAMLHTGLPTDLLHANYTDESLDRYEFEANLFAVTLLINKDELNTDLSRLSGYMLKSILKDNIKMM
jgi:Zn-dependent peptidase ImmA (M78 family)